MVFRFMDWRIIAPVSTYSPSLEQEHHHGPVLPSAMDDQLSRFSVLDDSFEGGADGESLDVSVCEVSHL